MAHRSSAAAGSSYAALGLSLCRAIRTPGQDARSAGITDLRFGNLQDANWQERNHATTSTTTTAGPRRCRRGVQAYLLRPRSPSARPGAPRGDPATAWCRSRGAETNTAGPDSRWPYLRPHRHVVSGCGHLDLLCRDEVSAQLRFGLA
ncbi:MAG: hypothetical protein IPG91_13245 [Ideonella sp.]|nr:hypothetical protein [Ideonella sp.]